MIRILNFLNRLLIPSDHLNCIGNPCPIGLFLNLMLGFITIILGFLPNTNNILTVIHY